MKNCFKPANKVNTFLIVLLIITENVISQGISYNSNTFWSSDVVSIKEYEIVNNEIVSTGTILPLSCMSLAFCNNLDGGNFSPTFYTHGVSASNSADFYDGINWVAGQSQSTCPQQNCGGYGNFLYYQTLNETPNCSERYDGISFTSVFSEDTLFFTVADLAVDEDGNVWCFMGQTVLNSTYIRVYSPDGQLLKQFDIDIDTGNAYGCFLMNNVFYLGLGHLNTVFPNTLLPIYFTENSAIIGTPITAGLLSSSIDLASAKPGKPLSKASTSEISKLSTLSVYPTIIEKDLKINFESDNQSLNRLSIVNEIGTIIFTCEIETKSNKFEQIIDLSKFSNGVYFILLENSMETTRKKIIKY